jgi:hypothetical protein
MNFTPAQLNVVAAVFGHSNMGMELPTVDAVRFLLRLPKVTLSTAVMHISGGWMESDEHQDIFEEEARSWVKNPELASLESIQPVWPHIGKLLEEALNEPA